MNTDIQTIQVALANEARRQEVRQKIATLTGAANATASVVQRLNSINSDTLVELEAKRAELAALEAGAGPGVTADYGPKSTITQLIEMEREAAKSAAIDFVKANPDCVEWDADQAWDDAALASHPDFPHVIQPGAVMLTLYRTNMAAAGIIAENTWVAQRAWVLMTDKAKIMAM